MSAVVLMYHRVAALPEDPYGIAVHPARFAEHVEVLRSLGGVVPLQQVRAGRAARYAITFDDGYADNATTAAPLLAEAGLPATYFLTSARLGGRRFWWDRLASGLLGAHPLPTGADVEVGDRPLWLALHDRAAREAALHVVHRRLRALAPEQLEPAVDGLLAALGAPPPGDDGVTMDEAQLRALAALPGVEVGAHTRTHAQLAWQSPAVQEREVAGSVQDLQALLGRPVDSFAYPFGGSSAVGDLAPRLVRQAGCSLAVSTDPGRVTGASDPWRLPRLNVRDWTGVELRDRLRALQDA